MTEKLHTSRYARQIELFGAAGQDHITRARVVLAGAGGLSSHLAQQLAYLGVRDWVVIDPDLVEETNLNRLIGATQNDIDGPKVEVTARMIRTITPNAAVVTRQVALPYQELDSDLAACDLLLAGLDRESPRLALLDSASRAGVPYIDAATEVHDSESGPLYGGRVVSSFTGTGCLSCRDEIDQDELAVEQMSDAQRRARAQTYGVQLSDLQGSGPSIVTVNGVVASLAACEAMALLTGLRAPIGAMTYRGDRGTVNRNGDQPRSDCYYCARLAA